MRILKFLEAIKLADYPNLKKGENFIIIDSNDNYNYNCIAYTLGSNKNTIYPKKRKDWGWPFLISENIAINLDIINFINFYKLFGYIVCRNSLYETDYDKIALYTHKSRYFVHAAIQKDNKWWISKMGENELFEHNLEALFNDNINGKVYFVKRPKNSSINNQAIIDSFYKNNL